MFIMIFAIVYFISSTFLCLDCIRINLRACKTKKNSGGGPPDPPHWRTNVSASRTGHTPTYLLKHPHLAIPSYATACSIQISMICRVHIRGWHSFVQQNRLASWRLYSHKPFILFSSTIHLVSPSQQSAPCTLN